MKNAKIKEFYKELYADIKEILKPYGFRKKGDQFRRLSPDGIIEEIAIQRYENDGVGSYWFTINLNLTLLDPSVSHDFWEKIFPGIWCCLGDNSEGGQYRQKWYFLEYYIHPHLQAQIVDGRFPSRHKNDGDEEWETTWIPVPDFDEIKAEVCDLIKHKALPFLMSVQTKQEYLELLKKTQENINFSVQRNPDAAKLYAKVYGADYLPLLSEDIRSYEDILESEMSDDLSGYDEINQDGQKQRVAMLRGIVSELRDIEAKLKEGFLPI